MNMMVRFLCTFMCVVCYFQALSLPTQKRYVRYVDYSQANCSFFENKRMPLKEKREASNKGCIVLSYDEDLPDSIKIAFIAAKKMWESKLPSKQPIFISIIFEPLGDSISMVSEVAYCETPNILGCPCALASQLANIPYGTQEAPDGIIVLNSDKEWNCRFTDIISPNYNLPTMVLRGIARCLGFGTCIFDEGSNVYSFRYGYPSYFDKLLYYNGNALSNVKERSSEMAEFVTSNDVFASTQNNKYKIYSPNHFVNHVSLSYFDNVNSLMSFTLGQGNVILDIDDSTLDVLGKLGWNLSYSGCKIKCDNIADDGIGSSYMSHMFYLSEGYEGITSCNWKYYLKCKSGEFVLVSSEKTEKFTIIKPSSFEEYFVNINGDMEGRVECDYVLNGKQYSATPFYISLELKPSIISIDNISIKNSNGYVFSLQCNVHYAGADYVSVEVEEEYNTSLRNYKFNEPYIAHVTTGNITNLYYSWITVLAENKYGTAYETLEFSPISKKQRKSKSDSLDSAFYEKDSNLCEIQLYDFLGNIIFKGTQKEYINQTFSSGMYLKKDIYYDGNSKSSKVFIR